MKSELRVGTEVVDDLEIEIVRGGSGKTLLFLHAVEGPSPDADWIRHLADSYEVIAPWHPGFGMAKLPKDYRTVGDLALFYLELIEQLKIKDAVLVGASFGGWLAAEVAVRSHAAFSHAVFVDPVGIRVGDRETRDIADVFAISQAEMTELAYHDPSKRIRDYSTMSDRERLMIARSRETYTKLVWQPYMHNPSLRHWLRRVRVPSLVLAGESDGIVSPDYPRQFAAALPDAEFRIIEEAGHYPLTEQPSRTTQAIREFIDSRDAITESEANRSGATR